MGDQTQAYDIFQTHLSSGYPLPSSYFSPLKRHGEKWAACTVPDFTAAVAVAYQASMARTIISLIS